MKLKRIRMPYPIIAIFLLQIAYIFPLSLDRIQVAAEDPINFILPTTTIQYDSDGDLIMVDAPANSTGGNQGGLGFDLNN